ncbi:MAG: pentapeptide repeat-containing protein [Alphaproteobacteria bacterium]|nr:pentapeptide repeat-containing protein [Alphaproteobacteria bacterium]
MSDEDKISRLNDAKAVFLKKENNEAKKNEPTSPEDGVGTWHAVSQSFDFDIGHNNFMSSIDFVGKNLENGKFAHENLQNANFSVANLVGVDFSGANLVGVDFSGANLTNADLSGADLSGAILSGSVLNGTNFTGAKLNGVKFTEADLENAILLDIEIDDLGIEELQELIEYIAKYYPHKLNLTKINLTLLNLQKIDLSQVNLKGVDFTGCDFTGVNIMELDLSECIITPEQIAQALGRVPSKEELAKILAPKKKKPQKFNGVDISSIFLGDGKEFGVWDVINDKGIKVETLVNLGKKVFKHVAKKPEVKDEEVLNNVKSEKELITKTHNEELRKVIEERKRKELESRVAKKKEFEQELSKDNKPKEKHNNDKAEMIIRRGRDGR